MNELNVVNSKVTTDLVKPEITGHATSNFETTFPIPKIGEVKMKIDVTSTVTSSIAAQEKLDELAEKRANLLLTKKDIHYGNEFLCSNPGKEKG